jgi:hypothetical protein
VGWCLRSHARTTRDDAGALLRGGGACIDHDRDMHRPAPARKPVSWRVPRCTKVLWFSPSRENFFFEKKQKTFVPGFVA